MISLRNNNLTLLHEDTFKGELLISSFSSTWLLSGLPQMVLED
jgi:hypothetical protein